MFLVLAVLAFFGPVLAALLTFIAGLLLLRTLPMLATVQLFGVTLLGLLLLWEFRYDLGLSLPDWGWLPSGGQSESVLMALTVLILGTQILALFRLPTAAPGRRLTWVSAILWALALAAFGVMSGLSYSP